MSSHFTALIELKDRSVSVVMNHRQTEYLPVDGVSVLQAIPDYETAIVERIKPLLGEMADREELFERNSLAEAS